MVSGRSASTSVEDASQVVEGFVGRLKTALGGRVPGQVAKQADISTSAMSRYMAGDGEPTLQSAVRLARVLGVNLIWLATGDGAPNVEAGGHVGVPIFDVRLAAGAASFTDGVRVLGEMPFDRELLRQLGRDGAEELGVVEAEGDSMEPTIADGARVVVDFRDTRLREGVFAFRLGDELRIKRLRRRVDGVEILSDNARYPAEALVGAQLEDFAVIGRALWSGSVL